MHLWRDKFIVMQQALILIMRHKNGDKHKNETLCYAWICFKVTWAFPHESVESKGFGSFYYTGHWTGQACLQWFILQETFHYFIWSKPVFIFKKYIYKSLQANALLMQWSSNILSFLSVSSFKLVKKKKKYRFICKNVKKYLCTIIICVTYRTLPLVKNKNKCRILKHTAFRLLWKYIFFLYISKKSQQSS